MENYNEVPFRQMVGAKIEKKDSERGATEGVGFPIHGGKPIKELYRTVYTGGPGCPGGEYMKNPVMDPKVVQTNDEDATEKTMKSDNGGNGDARLEMSEGNPEDGETEHEEKSIRDCIAEKNSSHFVKYGLNYMTDKKGNTIEYMPGGDPDEDMQAYSTDRRANELSHYKYGVRTPWNVKIGEMHEKEGRSANSISPTVISHMDIEGPEFAELADHAVNYTPGDMGDRKQMYMDLVNKRLAQEFGYEGGLGKFLADLTLDAIYDDEHIGTHRVDDRLAQAKLAEKITPEVVAGRKVTSTLTGKDQSRIDKPDYPVKEDSSEGSDEKPSSKGTDAKEKKTENKYRSNTPL